MEIKHYQFEEYHDKIRPYLKDIINDLKQCDAQKTQLTITINFFSSKDDIDGERVMHSKTDYKEIMISDLTDKVIGKLFNSLKNRYQNNLQLMRGSDFIFDYVELLYYKCHKINLNRGGSYIDFLDWIKNKKVLINLINKNDNKCFQYAITVALNYEEIKKRSAKNNKN